MGGPGGPAAHASTRTRYSQSVTGSSLPQPGPAPDPALAAPSPAVYSGRVRRSLLIRWGLRVLTGLIALVVLYQSAWFFLQERFIFPGAYFRARQEAVGPPDPAIQQVWLTAPGGTRVEAWYAPGHGRSAEDPGPAVMFFHGNLDLIDDRWSVAQLYRDAGISALLIEYRGYGRMDGEPGQAAIGADALLVHDWLQERPEVRRDQIILHGISIGGALAAQLARERPPAALLIESSFTNLPALVRRYGVIGALCEDEYRTDEVVSAYAGPLLLLHGRNDWLIPLSHSRRLHALAPRSRLVEHDGGHANYRPRWEVMRDFLEQAGLLPGSP